jgi:hypothetical protein
MLSKEEADKFMKIKGNIRGEGILTDIRYIRQKEGEEGIKMLEKKFEELGNYLSFKKIRPMDWYPVGIDILKMIIVKEIFGWTDKDIFEMGVFSAKVSFVVRILMKYFISSKKSFSESPRYWRTNFDFGELEAHEFIEEKKYMSFRLRGFEAHPLMCLSLAGYFLQIAKYVLDSKKVTIEETACSFKGAPYHEYTMKWE